MLDLLREDDDLSNKDVPCLCLRATATADVEIYPLQWWSVNPKRFLTMQKI